MAKVLLGCLVGRVAKEAIIAFRSLLDFIYLSQYPTHSDETLAYLQNALNTFEDHKHIFINLHIRDDLNIPKFHSLLHYIQSIRLFGTTDNYNTEMFERLHIDFAKEAWRSTNHRDERPQMVKWLDRRERMVRFEQYVKHVVPEAFPPSLPASTSRIGTNIVTVAQRPKVAHASITNIELSHNAPGFIRSLKEYLNSLSLHPLPRSEIPLADLPIDTVKLFHTFSVSRVELGHTEVLGSSLDKEILRAKPRSQTQSARFDTVIVLDSDEAESTGVQGRSSCLFTR